MEKQFRFNYEHYASLEALPEADLVVNAALCAGVTPQRHEAALETLRACQVEVLLPNP